MSDWKEQLLNKVTATHKRHVLLCDEDFLLSYPSITRNVQAYFTLVNCETNLQVRIQFELRQAQPDVRLLFVVPSGYQPLPDIALRAYFLKLNLSDLFPMFDRATLIGLDEPILDALSAQKVYEKQSL